MIDTLYVTRERSYFLALGQDVFNPDGVVRLCQNELLCFATFAY